MKMIAWSLLRLSWLLLCGGVRCKSLCKSCKDGITAVRWDHMSGVALKYDLIHNLFQLHNKQIHKKQKYMNIPTTPHIDKRKCKAIDVYLNLADHMWLGCLSKRNLQGLISSGPRLTSNLFVILSSPKFDASFLVFRAWAGFLVALLQMTVFRCTYVPQSWRESCCTTS